MSPRRMGVGDITVTVPVTLGCGMKLMPVISPMVLSTVRISTLSKLTQINSLGSPVTCGSSRGDWAPCTQAVTGLGSPAGFGSLGVLPLAVTMSICSAKASMTTTIPAW